MDFDWPTRILALLYIVFWLQSRARAWARAGLAKVWIPSPPLTRWIFFYVLASSLFTAIGGSNGPRGWIHFGAGVLLLVGSALLAALALKHLGRQYSFEIEIKESHKIVDTGPYRLVRHPIYLSDAVGYLGMCLIGGAAYLWLALPVFLVGLYLMIRREEKALRSICGRNYSDYCQATMAHWHYHIPWIDRIRRLANEVFTGRQRKGGGFR